MTDTLLLFPPVSLKERYGKRSIGDVKGMVPPLGLAYLASFIRQKDFSVQVIDAIVDNYTDEKLIEYIKSEKPKVIGISSLTLTFNRAIITAESIRKNFPDILIIIGGHHATIVRESLLKENPCFDICVYGEGELILLELLDEYRKLGWDRNGFLKNNETLSKIKGISYIRDQNVIINPPRELIKDLDKLPMPAREFFDMKKYVPLPNQYKRLPSIHMTVTRGCPFSCSYCSASSVFGRGFRLSSPQKVIAEIEYIIEKYGAKEISFWDDAFTVNKKWVREVCQLMIDKKLDITWTCYGRVRTVDKEILQLMRKAGCWNMFFGFESGVQELLDLINKNITLDEIRQVVKWCKEVDIEVRASFMIALPTETPQMAQQTIDFAIELEPDYAQFCVTTPFPETKLFEDAKKYGDLALDFDKYSVWEPVFLPHGYKSREEILEMEKIAVRKFYYRFSYVWNRIRKIRSPLDIWRYIEGFIVTLGFSNAGAKSK
jgi:radical SAM superfamily enzyme YgiQ (UPF0313 family)